MLSILFARSEATICFGASHADKAVFAASSASLVALYADMAWNPTEDDIFPLDFC